MNKKTTGIVAGVAGAALLMGGATFALWNDSADVAGAAITAGNLDLGTVTHQWYDVSDDRTDAGHEIANLAKFQIIPGDTVAAEFTIPAALQGDNMVAELSLDGLTHPTGALLPGLEASYEVKLGEESLAKGNVYDAKPLRFASEDNEQRGAMPALPVALGDTGIEVVVEVTFREDISGVELTNAKAALKEFDVTLTQVRDEGVGGGF